MRPLLLLPCLSALCLAAEPAATPVPATPAPAAGAAGTTPAVTVVEPKPFLGLRFDATAANFATEPGIPVAELVPGATGQVLGIEVGDRILSINGRTTKNLTDLQAVLGNAKVGDNVTFTFQRGGSEQSITGPLMAKPKPVNVGAEVSKAQKALDDVRALAESKAREPSLPELLQQLKDIQTGLPRAVAAFKKQYPNGTFDIRISVTICSDATAKDPLEFSNEATPAPKPEAKDAKPEAKDAKPETKTK